MRHESSRPPQKRICSRDETCPKCTATDCYLERDRRLLKEIQKGNGDALVELVEHYESEIRKYLRYRGLDQMAVDDVFSETAYTIVKKIHTFEWRGIPIKVWFFQIANRKLSEYYGEMKVNNELVSLMLDIERKDEMSRKKLKRPVEVFTDRPKNLENQTERDRRIQKALKNLSEKEADIIRLIYFKGIESSREIGKILGVPDSTVRVYHQRALKKLSQDSNIIRIISK